MLAKQTIPNTVIVARGMGQIHCDYSSLQGTWEFYVKRGDELFA